MKKNLNSLQIPRALRKGDTIGIAAPSSGLAELFPHRVEKGISMLEEMGFKVKVASHALNRNGWVSASAEKRASDLHDLFKDQEVIAIMATIGGNHANQILKHLDFDLISANPKIFIGYSDITVLHAALMQKAGLRTFYGPCLISELGEYPSILSYTGDWFTKTLTSVEAIGPIAAPEKWTDEFLDWFAKSDLTRPRSMVPHEGYEWWREGSAEGSLWGGALVSLNHLAGTEYWVDTCGSIFFLDIPEGGPGEKLGLSDVDALLADLDNLDVFNNISGLVIGRPYRYTKSDDQNLREVIEKYVAGKRYPILYNAPIGHTSPIITVPLGAKASLDSSQDLFSINEAGVI